MPTQTIITMIIQKPEKFELFEHFVNGQLGKEETRWFNYWIQKDPLFAEKVSQFSVVFSGLKTLRTIEIEKMLRRLNEGTKVETLKTDEVAELEFIERYFQQQLTDQEKIDFEYRMTTDANFKEKVEQYELIFSGLKESRIQALEKQVQEATKAESENEKESVKSQKETPVTNSKENGEEETKRKGIVRRLLPVVLAAAAALLLFFGLPFFQTSDADFYANLVSTYQEQPTVENLMSANPTETEALKKGKQLLIEKKYTEAINVLSPVSDNEEARLYLGHAYFGVKKYMEATSTYQSLQKSSNSDYSNEADWFLVQSYLAQLPAKKEELGQALKKILKSEGVHNYKNIANKLNKDLLSRD